MGRPPLGRAAMTATEYQRRWRQRRRQPPVPSQPQPSAPGPVTERAAAATDRALIETLIAERDQARRELALALHGPRAVGEGSEGRCFICHKPRDQVAVLLKASRSYFDLFLCNACASAWVEQCNEIIARRRALSSG